MYMTTCRYHVLGVASMSTAFTCLSETVSGTLSVSKPKKKTYQSEVRIVQGCSPLLGSAFTQKPNQAVNMKTRRQDSMEAGVVV